MSVAPRTHFKKDPARAPVKTTANPSANSTASIGSTEGIGSL